MSKKQASPGKEVGATISIYFASYFLSYLASVLISRLFGVEQYSDYAVATALLTMTSAVALLGFDKTTLQYLPRYFSCKRHNLAAHYIRSSFWIILLFSIGLSITISMGLVLFEMRRGEGMHHSLVLALCLLPIVTSVDYLNKLLITKKRLMHSLLMFRINQPVILMLLIVACYFFNIRTSVWLVACLGVAWTAILVCYLYWLRADLPHFAKAKHPTVCWRAWLPRALPFWVCGMVLIVIQNMGVLVLEIMNVDLNEVAIYAAVSQTCHFLIMVHTAVNIVALPRFAKIFSFRDNSQLQDNLNDYLRVIAYFCLLFFILVAFAGKAMLGLFGEEFVKGYSSLCVLSVGSIINVYCGLSTSLLQVAGLRRIVLRNAVLLFSITAVLMLVGVPLYGMMGAAWAFTIGMLIVNAQQLWYLQHKLGISFFAIFINKRVTLSAAVNTETPS